MAGLDGKFCGHRFLREEDGDAVANEVGEFSPSGKQDLVHGSGDGLARGVEDPALGQGRIEASGVLPNKRQLGKRTTKDGKDRVDHTKQPGLGLLSLIFAETTQDECMCDVFESRALH